MAQYKGHHKRDEFGNVLSRKDETAQYRLKHPGKRKSWDAAYRQTEEAHQSHQTYNESEKGKLNTVDGYLRRKYGKTLADKRDQRAKQHGLCAVCGKPLPTDIQRCHWDHNHTTGQLRDLLHGRCNIAVGFLESDICSPALAYIARHANV